jgi:hypothetical protein
MQRMLFTTVTDIVKGQEITVSYGGSSWSIAINYGFLCGCGACSPSATLLEEVKEWGQGTREERGEGDKIWWELYVERD